MSLQIDWHKQTFTFNFRARTSRGPMNDKTSWFIRVADKKDPSVAGMGECAPLPGLSPDGTPGFEARLQQVLDDIADSGWGAHDAGKILAMVPDSLPALRFGLEVALLDLQHGGGRIVFRNSFVEGVPIPINGLVWMGDIDFMMDQINKKVAEGFSCLKLKVGGLDFERECDVLRYIRKKYFRNDITIRLDANGAFKPDDVLYKLEALAKFDIHSIEQPLMPGANEMEELCRRSPIPIAFDEELIGVYGRERKEALLRRLSPQFIVLKPTLHGGFSGCDEWIRVAESLGIGWWITSALESSIGLNAICQFTANFRTTLPQGLGTGAIYTNNIASPLRVARGHIAYDSSLPWGV